MACNLDSIKPLSEPMLGGGGVGGMEERGLSTDVETGNRAPSQYKDSLSWYGIPTIKTRQSYL